MPLVSWLLRMNVGNIIHGDARDISNYPDEKFHLTVTSPPYFVGKNYEDDYTYEEYLDLLQSVVSNLADKTVDGGKIAINIADIAAFSKVSGRVEEGIDVSRFMKDWLGEKDCYLLSRFIWWKDAPWVNSQQVGYHDGIPATYVRALPNWEYIWVYYKGEPARADVPPIVDVISKEDWKKWVESYWYIRSVRANDDHAAKFPDELVRRLVLLYSIPGDTVFDPFLGSGTTAVVSYQNHREYAGIERDPTYHRLALENIRNTTSKNELFTAPTRFKQNRVVFSKEGE